MAIQSALAPVNWGDPLTHKLSLLIDLARHPGQSLPVNIAGGVSIAPAKLGSGTISVGTSEFGTGVRFPAIATNAGWDMAPASQFYGKTDFTLMWQGRFHTTNDIGSNSSLFGNGTPGAGDKNWLLAVDNDGNSGGLAKFYFYPVAATAVTSNTAYSYHRDYVIVCTYDGANGSIYIDGKLDISGACTGSSATAAGNRICLNDGFWTGASCIVRSVALWDRCLTPLEVARIGTNPLARLLTQRSTLADLYVAAGGGGGGSAGFKPAWARNSNVMIGVPR